MLHGVFEATSQGGLNLEPDAWSGSKAQALSPYPAQVRQRLFANCRPIPAGQFRPCLRCFGPSKSKFSLELNQREVKGLLALFQVAYDDATGRLVDPCGAAHPSGAPPGGAASGQRIIWGPPAAAAKPNRSNQRATGNGASTTSTTSTSTPTPTTTWSTANAATWPPQDASASSSVMTSAASLGVSDPGTQGHRGETDAVAQAPAGSGAKVAGRSGQPVHMQLGPGAGEEPWAGLLSSVASADGAPLGGTGVAVPGAGHVATGAAGRGGAAAASSSWPGMAMPAASMPHVAFASVPMDDGTRVAGMDLGNIKCVLALADTQRVCVLRHGDDVPSHPGGVGAPPLSGQGEPPGAGGATDACQVSTAGTSLSGIKRLLGRGFLDPMVQRELSHMPCFVQPGTDGMPQVLSHTAIGEPRLFTPRELLASSLASLKEMAERHGDKRQGGEGTTESHCCHSSPLTRNDAAGDTAKLALSHDSDGCQRLALAGCVLSCPVYFTDAQRRELLAAASLAQLPAPRLLHDTSAAVLAYAASVSPAELLPAYGTDARHLVFVDMGRTSTQVCVAAFSRGTSSILSTCFDECLGGRDFDLVLLDHFLTEAIFVHQLDVSTLPGGRARLLAACQATKHALSEREDAPMIVRGLLPTSRDFCSSITRATFEDICSVQLARIVPLVETALDRAGLLAVHVAGVELLGGGTRMPAVAQRIEEYFGVAPRRTLEGDEVVARGCLLAAAMATPAYRGPMFELRDALPFSISCVWGGEASGGITPAPPTTMVPLFPRGFPLPATKSLVFETKEPFLVSACYSAGEELPFWPHLGIGAIMVGLPDPAHPIVPGAPPVQRRVTLRVRINECGVLEMDTDSAAGDVMASVNGSAQAAMGPPTVASTPGATMLAGTSALTTAQAAMQAGPRLTTGTALVMPAMGGGAAFPPEHAATVTYAERFATSSRAGNGRPGTYQMGADPAQVASPVQDPPSGPPLQAHGPAQGIDEQLARDTNAKLHVGPTQSVPATESRPMQQATEPGQPQQGTQEGDASYQDGAMDGRNKQKGGASQPSAGSEGRPGTAGNGKPTGKRLSAHGKPARQQSSSPLIVSSKSTGNGMVQAVWHPVLDTNTGLTYYWNKETNETSWDPIST
eukprot:jgi/Mesvir1/26349/Mv22522-RA.2